MIGKAKAACTSKAKQGIHSPLPMGRQVLSHLQESRASSRAKVTWEENRHHGRHPPFLLLSPAFIASAECHMVWDIASVPSQLLAHLQPPRRWVRNRKGPDAVQPLISSSYSTGALPTNPKHRTTAASEENIDSIPAKPRPMGHTHLPGTPYSHLLLCHPRHPWEGALGRLLL